MILIEHACHNLSLYFILIVVLIILLFGAKKIPELMKGLGKGVKEFKDATNNPDGKDDTKGEVNEKNN